MIRNSLDLLFVNVKVSNLFYLPLVSFFTDFSAQQG